MIKSKNKEAGFTLIEMMVVIAVIGILSAAVLAGLAPARKKARDARVISGVNQARTVVEALAGVGGYPDPVVLSGDAQYKAADADVKSVNSVGIIYNRSDDNNYTLSAKLASDPTKLYCVDAQGAAKTGGVPGSSSTCL